MSLKRIINRLKKKEIVFKTHPNKPGYAILANDKYVKEVNALGYGSVINSVDFEKMQEKINCQNTKLFWIS